MKKIEKEEISRKQQATTHQIHGRLILLYNARTKYGKRKILHPKEKACFDLWEHVKDCGVEDCKRRHCRSSREALSHFKRCHQRNQQSTCKLCAPVIKYMTKESHGRCHLIKHKSIHTRGKQITERTMLFDIDENKLSTE